MLQRWNDLNCVLYYLIKNHVYQLGTGFVKIIFKLTLLQIVIINYNQLIYKWWQVWNATTGPLSKLSFTKTAINKKNTENKGYNS